MKRFTPVSDDKLYSDPRIIQQLVPYQVGSRQPVEKSGQPSNLKALPVLVQGICGGRYV